MSRTRGGVSMLAMTPTPDHTRRALVKLAAQRPTVARGAVVRRYRLARVAPRPSSAPAPDRFAHLRRSYD